MAAEPGLAEPIWAQSEAATRVADAVSAALAAGEPVAVVGCGTSEHAAMAVAALIREALVDRRRAGWPVAARQAAEAALDPWPGLCLAVSHEGGTRATLAALEAARATGAATALITADPASPCARAAALSLVTPLVDRAWCHTVGYLSPILAGACIAAALSGSGLGWEPLRRHLEESAAAAAAQAAPLALALGGGGLLECAGGGADAISARELALKIEEAVHRPAVGRDLETVLHGHLVARDPGTRLVVFATDGALERRLERAAQLLAAATRIGQPSVAIVREDAPFDFAGGRPAGQMRLPRGAHLPAVLASLTGSALALQHLTLALAAAAGTNPDLIRREQAPYREAAELAEASPAI